MTSEQPLCFPPNIFAKGQPLWNLQRSTQICNKHEYIISHYTPPNSAQVCEAGIYYHVVGTVEFHIFMALLCIYNMPQAQRYVHRNCCLLDHSRLEILKYWEAAGHNVPGSASPLYISDDCCGKEYCYRVREQMVPFLLFTFSNPASLYNLIQHSISNSKSLGLYYMSVRESELVTRKPCDWQTYSGEHISPIWALSWLCVPPTLIVQGSTIYYWASLKLFCHLFLFNHIYVYTVCVCIYCVDR